jgi:ABC-type uncharacterized transport system involved in gliding motility auxiliary subunit
MTKNKMFSLSEPTYKVLDSLTSDINIYGFFESGKEEPTIKAILEKYAARSKKVKIEYKDPVKYPQFAKKYSDTGEVAQGSIVVESGDKFRVISPYDLVNYGYDMSGNPRASSLAIEQRVTGAITYVTSKENPVIYALEGHGEQTLPEEVTKHLLDLNYTIKNLNLTLKDAKLDDNGALLIMGPSKDLSQSETETIKSYLSKGGKAVFLMGLTRTDLPNFESLLNSYGVGIQKSFIVEGEPSYSTQNPIVIIPEMKSHDILSSVTSNKLKILMPGAQGIELKKIKKSSTKIEPLLVTSKNSWAKTNLDATTTEKEPGDLTGPFNVAVAITDTLDNGNETKMVVVSNSLFVNGQYAMNAANVDFITNSFNWLQNREDSVSIVPKEFDNNIMNINAAQQLIISGLVVIIIPLVIVIMGLRVWFRRKHQ